MDTKRALRPLHPLAGTVKYDGSIRSREPRRGSPIYHAAPPVPDPKLRGCEGRNHEATTSPTAIPHLRRVPVTAPAPDPMSRPFFDPIRDALDSMATNDQTNSQLAPEDDVEMMSSSPQAAESPRGRFGFTHPSFSAATAKHKTDKPDPKPPKVFKFLDISHPQDKDRHRTIVRSVAASNAYTRNGNTQRSNIAVFPPGQRGTGRLVRREDAVRLVPWPTDQDTGHISIPGRESGSGPNDDPDARRAPRPPVRYDHSSLETAEPELEEGSVHSAGLRPRPGNLRRGGDDFNTGGVAKRSPQETDPAYPAKWPGPKRRHVISGPRGCRSSSQDSPTSQEMPSLSSPSGQFWESRERDVRRPDSGEIDYVGNSVVVRIKTEP